jgi:ribosomal-protein-alanine N-acetyltransferase
MSSMTRTRDEPPILDPGLELLDWVDIPVLVELEEILFPGDSPWNWQMFAGELEAGHHYVVHRDADGTIDGYAGLAIAGSEAEVHTIGVRPTSQGTGLGRKLLRQLLAAAADRRVLLEVRTDNQVAIGLYESEGFVRLGVRRRYYQPSGADAYTMARPR